MVGQNPNEIFDVVDENDAVVGKATRAEVHARRLWHRAVHILVMNDKGEVLLQKRSPYKDTYPNAWTTSCAGHVDSGEDYLPAALRELREELGLCAEASDMSVIGKFPPCAQTGWEWITVYAIKSVGPFNPDPSEVAEVRFCGQEAIEQLKANRSEVIAPSFLYVWDKFRSISTQGADGGTSQR